MENTPNLIQTINKSINLNLLKLNNMLLYFKLPIYEEDFLLFTYDDLDNFNFDDINEEELYLAYVEQLRETRTINSFMNCGGDLNAIPRYCIRIKRPARIPVVKMAFVICLPTILAKKKV